MKMTLRTAPLSALMLVSLARVDSSGIKPSTEAPIETGRYEAVYSSKTDSNHWKDSDLIIAEVDRKSETVVFTLADGSKKTLNIAPRPKEKWQGDCATMNSSVLCEVADLSPGSLELASLTFKAPLLYAKCSRERLIVSEMPLNSGPFIAFNRVSPFLNGDGQGGTGPATDNDPAPRH